MRPCARSWPRACSTRWFMPSGKRPSIGATLCWRNSGNWRRSYPDDAAVREWLAKGLFNTLNDARQEEALERRDALLAGTAATGPELSRRCGRARALAKGLFNTLNDARQEEALERRDALLEELRQLARDYPDDAAVRESLAKACQTRWWTPRRKRRSSGATLCWMNSGDWPGTIRRTPTCARWLGRWSMSRDFRVGRSGGGPLRDGHGSVPRPWCGPPDRAGALLRLPPDQGRAAGEGARHDADKQAKPQVA